MADSGQENTVSIFIAIVGYDGNIRSSCRVQLRSVCYFFIEIKFKR